MKTFKNNKTGVIYEVTNEVLVEQYESRKDLYTEITKGATNEPTLNELKKKAKEMGIDYDNKVKKDELLALISAKENEE